MSDSPASYLCGRCTRRFSEDGICPECNLSLIPVDTIPCLECGSELKPDAKFCSHCGNVLQGKCDNCGTVLMPDDLFCSDCGKKNPSTKLDLPKAKQRQEDISNVGGDELIELMYSPVNLRDFHNNFSFLSTGPDSEEYNTAIERGLEVAKEPPIIVRLGSYPRRWAIKKPGLFRRFLTMIIDMPLWIGFCLVVLAVVIGSKDGGGLLRALGMRAEGPRGLFALIWCPLSYLVYTAGAEILFGTTIGGLVAGTRVVNDYGNSLTPWEIVKRQFSRLIAPLMAIMGGNGDHEIVVR